MGKYWKMWEKPEKIHGKIPRLLGNCLCLTPLLSCKNIKQILDAE